MRTTKRRILLNYLLLLLIVLKGILPGAAASSLVGQHNALKKGDVLLLCSAGDLRYVSASAYFEQGIFVDIELDEDFLSDAEHSQIVCPLEQYCFQLGVDDSLVYPPLYSSQQQTAGPIQLPLCGSFSAPRFSQFARGPPVSSLVS